MIKIAILGLGTVGTGVVKVVEANTAPIQHKLGQPLSVKTALVRKLRADPYQHLMTENFREIEHDGEIRVVVETIGGVEAAYEYPPVPHGRQARGHSQQAACGGAWL